jgi:6-pyruvoyltetrahydropterin/6-carboxytetrahydropterin synthase
MFPTGNPHFDILQHNDELHLKYKQKKYVFPLEDCVILPIPNTTTEHLARYLAVRIGDTLGLTLTIYTITVEVEENFGLSARYSHDHGRPF